MRPLSLILYYQLKTMILRTLDAYVDLFDEDHYHQVPLIKMELILDDDDCIQFYPGLDELENVITGGVKTILCTLQKIPTVQVRIKFNFVSACICNPSLCWNF